MKSKTSRKLGTWVELGISLLAVIGACTVLAGLTNFVRCMLSP